jgi:outer membrane protein assembly factor BamB/flagellar hook assembly protein FlgD
MRRMAFAIVFLFIIIPFTFPLDIELKWKTKIGITGWGNNLVITRDLIFIGSWGSIVFEDDETDGLYALDPLSGRVMWKFRTRNSTGSFTLDDINGDGLLEVIIGSWDGDLLCIGSDGRERWKFKTGSVSSSPSLGDIDGDGLIEIVAGSHDGNLYCIDSDGKEKWRFKTDSKVQSSPSLGDIDRDGLIEIVVGSWDGNLYCIDSDGKEKWRFKTGNVDSSPSLGDIDRDGLIEIVVGSLDRGSIYCISSDGREKWRFETSNYVVSSPSLGDIDGDDLIEIVVGSRDGNIYCIDSDGKERWRLEIGGVDSSPALGDIDGDGLLEVIVGSYDDNIYCISSDGKVMWRFKTNGDVISSPSLGDLDGDSLLEIVVSSWDGYLYCFDAPGGGKIAWAKFKGDSYNTGLFENAIRYGELAGKGFPGFTALPFNIISPSHPSSSEWYTDPTVIFTWQPNVKGILGYYVIFDRNEETELTPETAQDYVIGTSKTYENVEDGTWFFHIRGEYETAELTLTLTFPVHVNAIPEVDSTSHPEEEIWYQERDVTLSWEKLPGTKAFYYILDHASDTTEIVFPNLSDGIWFFHFIWEDSLGKLSKVTHRKIQIDDTDPEPVTELWVERVANGLKLSWSEPKDAMSGVASYQIYRSRFEKAIGTRIAKDITDTEFIDKSAEKGKVYYYTVMPVDKAGNKQVKGNIQVSSAVLLSIQPGSGFIGSELNVSGDGFDADERIKVKFSSITKEVKADGEGKISLKLSVPTLPAGEHTLTATGESGKSASGVFEVKPRISSISPKSTSVGGLVTIVGDGFAANKEVNVTVGGKHTSIISGGKTTSDGRLTVDAIIPETSLGSQVVRVNDGENEVSSSVQIVEGEPVISGKGKFTLHLSEGLNMVSMPLKPDLPMDAKEFASKLGATVVIRLNESTKMFEAFIPEVGVVNFPIEGGHGYIVNMRDAKSVEVEGRAWFSAPSAVKKTSKRQWAFALGGEVLGGETVGFTVEVRNRRTGEVSMVGVKDGRFATAFADMSRCEVVRLGDALEVTVRDAGGKVVSGPLEVRVGKDELVKAVALVQMWIGDVIPERTELLPNYPNPFNPETWIPFRLAEDGEVVIRIYDLRGRLVRKLALGRLKAGIYERRDRAAYWDGRNEMGESVSSGIYVIELSVGGFRAVRRMCLIR